MEPGELGRRIPTDWKHVDKYPLRTLVDFVEPVAKAERVLLLPWHYRTHYDQGTEGACVGFALSWGMSILNRQRYDARRLYREAQLIDEWSDTPPGEGTSVRAGLDILRTRGHWTYQRNRIATDPDPIWGIVENRWATTVDEVRSAIQGTDRHQAVPVFFGINWYTAFDHPEKFKNEHWIGRGELGAIRGGHAICAYKVSDRRQAVGFVNSWGASYPTVWMPYTVVQRVLNESGEAGLVTDRV